MPTYEYLCDKCGHEFEKFQSMADKPLKTCPKELCGLKSWGKGRVRKLIGAGAGLLFKGSGFYITDYRSEGYKAAAKKESGATSGTDGKGAAAGDTKPATAKSDTKSTSKPAKEAK
jgi:putative FmdB family regulatory protein